MRKILLIALLPIILIAVFFMQGANALTPRMDFSDNHYTYISPGGTKVCGSHLCKPGEWDQWKKQLMLNQLKKSGTVTNKNSIQDKTKSVSYGDGITTGIVDGKITRVDTINMGNGDYVSFVTVSSGGTPIHDIKISQTNSNVNVKKAWINPLWDVKITTNMVTLDSSKMYLLPSDSVGIVIVTDDKNPVFNLDSVA
ncbi:MAG: hypothetical protein ABI340_02290 [Nitrososphaera sp.]|jgi:hypothetical protein